MIVEIGREYGLKDIDGKIYYICIRNISGEYNKLKFCFIGFVFYKCVGYEIYIILLCFLLVFCIYV